MGAYLSAPVTHKDYFEGTSADVIYGGASMQVSEVVQASSFIFSVQALGTRLEDVIQR